jgi:hypothetical protein
MQHYIASTDINATPHVTAQWTDDQLDEITVNNLDGPLTYKQFMSAWRIAQDLKSQREKCTGWVVTT